MGNKVWTRNYDNLFSSVFGTYGVAQDNNAVTPSYDTPCYRSHNGNYYKIHITNNRYVMFTFNQGNWCYGTNPGGVYYPYPLIVLGTGEGIATKDDYQLFTPINSGFSVNPISITWRFDAATHTYTKKFIIPLLYTGDNEVRITEFGISIALGEEPYSVSYDSRAFGLLYHEFLDAAKVLNKNDVIEITFEQSIVQPNYTPYPSE